MFWCSAPEVVTQPQHSGCSTSWIVIVLLSFEVGCVCVCVDVLGINSRETEGEFEDGRREEYV